MIDYLKVATTDEIPVGAKKIVEIDYDMVAIFNIDGEFLAVEDICTHDGGTLADGEVKGDEIICPRHGAKFSLRTGKALCMPAYEPIESYTIKVENGDIYVGVE